jgi:pyruvate/2-oxoglutarate dehydrogenase complex dihydrolipoamide acyltransferase (E2) component
MRVVWCSENIEGVKMSTEVKVPDIGDFKDVPVIEVHAKPGQVVKAEDTLITFT